MRPTEIRDTFDGSHPVATLRAIKERILEKKISRREILQRERERRHRRCVLVAVSQYGKKKKNGNKEESADDALNTDD